MPIRAVGHTTPQVRTPAYTENFIVRERARASFGPRGMKRDLLSNADLTISKSVLRNIFRTNSHTRKRR